MFEDLDNPDYKTPSDDVLDQIGARGARVRRHRIVLRSSIAGAALMAVAAVSVVTLTNKHSAADQIITVPPISAPPTCTSTQITQHASALAGRDTSMPGVARGYVGVVLTVENPSKADCTLPAADVYATSITAGVVSSRLLPEGIDPIGPRARPKVIPQPLPGNVLSAGEIAVIRYLITSPACGAVYTFLGGVIYGTFDVQSTADAHWCGGTARPTMSETGYQARSELGPEDLGNFTTPKHLVATPSSAAIGSTISVEIPYCANPTMYFHDSYNLVNYHSEVGLFKIPLTIGTTPNSYLAQWVVPSNVSLGQGEVDAVCDQGVGGSQNINVTR